LSAAHLQAGVVSIPAPVPRDYEDILTPEAIDFLAELRHKFDGRRKELLERPVLRQKAIDAGQHPDFLPTGRSRSRACA
jgi:malate synthase